MKINFKKKHSTSFFYGQSLVVTIAYGFSPIAIGYDIYLYDGNKLVKYIASITDRKLLFPILRTIMKTNNYL